MTSITNPSQVHGLDGVLSSWKLSHLVYNKRELVSISTNTVIEHALHLLKEHNLLALPVFDESQHKFVGIITVLDIMSYVAFGAFKNSATTNKSTDDDDAFHAYEAALTTVDELIGIRDEDKVVSILNKDTPIIELLEPMCKGIHRVLVDMHELTRDGKPSYRLVTQSDLVRFMITYMMSKRDDVLHPNLNSSIESLKIGTRSIKSITTEASALDGFRVMDSNDLAAIAVVDASNGALISTLSASDLRGLRTFTMTLIKSPVMQFLHHQRGTLADRVVVCTENSTLQDVCINVLVNKVHRVWIVDDSARPIGVISLTDIIRAFYSNIPE